MDGPISSEALEHERRALERAGRLRWFHWLILAFPLVVTLYAWQGSSEATKRRAALRFERQAEQVVALFVERLRSYADLLQSGTGLIVASETVTDAEWRHYVATLDLAERYPAITGLGVMDRVMRSELPAYLARRRESRPDFALHSAHERAIHLPMAHISPKRYEAGKLGLDLANETRRFEAANQALDRATVRITAPVRPTPRDALGFLMFAPFYRDPAIEQGMQHDARSLAGAFVAAVLVEDLAAGVLARDRRMIWLRITDAGETLYDELDAAHELADPDPMYSRSETRTVYGREWRFDIATTLAFRSDSASHTPTLVLVGGLLIDAMLLGLFMSLSRANRNALSFARLVAEELRAESETLALANRELESFAYVVSHDLRTPLNGIGHLVDFIKEDLDDIPTGEAAFDEIGRNVERIGAQAERGRALIAGILDYSGLGTSEERATRVDTRKLVEDIGESLSTKEGELVLVGDFPVLVTYETRLSQVLANLIGNAFKYHHDAAHARVTVRIEGRGHVQRISIEDDGPGIHPNHHERIFKLFQTLNSGEEIESTGVGLSIVKRTVELMGGSISLDSVPGRGSIFTVDWPTCVVATGGASEATGGESRGASGLPHAA